MKLSILDRIIIMESILPETGTIEQIRLKASIKNKIKLSEEESKTVKPIRNQYNFVTIEGLSSNETIRSIDFSFTLEELELLKVFANSVNDNGWVTESSLDTIEYIINYISQE